MGTLLLLIIFGAAIYVLWFMKFKLADGTEVKGWLNKFLEEKKGTTNGAPQNPAPNPAPAANQPANQPVNQPGKNIDDADNDVKVRHQGRLHLGDQSQLKDFELALDIVESNDAFSDESTDAMEEYVAWMLVMTGRIDDPVLNEDTIWGHLANAWARNIEVYERSYDNLLAKGEAEPWQKEKLPAWLVNNTFLNGVSYFIGYAPGHFEQATVHRINEMSHDFADDREGRQNANEEPLAGEYLARIYTIVHMEADSMIAKNIQMFRENFPIFFDLPQY